jgi:hypothetical protein
MSPKEKGFVTKSYRNASAECARMVTGAGDSASNHHLRALNVRLSNTLVPQLLWTLFTLAGV